MPRWAKWIVIVRVEPLAALFWALSIALYMPTPDPPIKCLAELRDAVIW